MNAVFLYTCFQCGNSTKKEIVRCAVCKSFGIAKVPMPGKVATTISHTLERHNQCNLFNMPNNLAPGIAISIAIIKNELLPIEIQMSVNGSKLVQPLIKRNITTIGLAKDRIYFILSMLPVYLKHINDTSSTIIEENKILINAIGGINVKKDVALDLSVACGIVSSMKQIAIFDSLVILGEIGINGEIKPVSYLKERLDLASKLGFKKAIIPNSNTKNYFIQNMEIKTVGHLEEALNHLFEDTRDEKPFCNYLGDKEEQQEKEDALDKKLSLLALTDNDKCKIIEHVITSFNKFFLGDHYSDQKPNEMFLKAWLEVNNSLGLDQILDCSIELIRLAENAKANGDTTEFERLRNIYENAGVFRKFCLKEFQNCNC